MSNQDLDILIHKQLTGQASPEEQSQFQVWLEADETHPGYFQKMTEIWAAAGTLDFKAEPETDAEWEKLRKKVEAIPSAAKPVARVVRMRAAWRWAAAAAAAVILGVALWWLLGRGDSGLTEPLHFAAANGKIENISLPDGTLVALNAGSTLDAQVSFGGRERRVKLSGEAFFQVQSNREKPFFVEAAGATVRVVGTKFNVRAYPSGTSVVTSVSEGKVEFFTDQQNKVQLTPGMEGILEKNTNRISTRQIEASGIAAWQRGVLAFDNVPLVEALEVIGRHYNVSVKIEGDIGGKQLFSTFENEPLEEVAQTLELTYNLDFEVKNDTLFVRNK